MSPTLFVGHHSLNSVGPAFSDWQPSRVRKQHASFLKDMAQWCKGNTTYTSRQTQVLVQQALDTRCIVSRSASHP